MASPFPGGWPGTGLSIILSIRTSNGLSFKADSNNSLSFVPAELRGRFNDDSVLRELVGFCDTEQRMREIFAYVDAQSGIMSPTGLAVKLARNNWQPSSDDTAKVCTLCGSLAFKGNGDGHLCESHYDDYQQIKQDRTEYGIKEYICTNTS